MATGQFALSMAGLEQLRDQFQRCWSFIKHNHKSSVGAAGNLPRPADSTPHPGPATLTSIVQKDQFGLMAQKNAGLRVEDLRPPPVKHRRTASSSVAPSPTPQTPQNAQTPQRVQTPQTGDMTAESPRVGTGAANRGRKGKVMAESVASVVASPKLQEDEVLTLKRKRELDEAEQDPDGFIVKALKTFTSTDNGVAATSFLSCDLTSHLPFDFDPVIPPPATNLLDIKPLSFSTLSTENTFAPPPLPTSSSTVAAAPQPFDFDFFIDSSAAGFYEAETPAETPELIGGGGKDEEASPPSDEENGKMAPSQFGSSASARGDGTKRTIITNACYTPGFEHDGFGDLPSATWDDFEESHWSGLPQGFAWEGDLPQGSWEIFSGDS